MRSRRVLLESWRRADMSVTIHSSMSELAEITGQSSLRRPIVHQLGVARSREALYYLSAGFLFLQTGAYSRDRKSTRLNSSHLGISYAVFCLKKKKEKLIIVIRHYWERSSAHIGYMHDRV